MPYYKVNGQDAIQQSVNSHKVTKTSQLQNDINLTTSSGTAYSADIVQNATTITSASGTPVGGFGPSGNVTINRTLGSCIIPRITVNAQGRITNVQSYTFTLNTP